MICCLASPFFALATLALSLGSVAGQLGADCRFHSVYITLGDRFDLNLVSIDDHAFTVGLTADGDCSSSDLKLALFDANNKSSKTVELWTDASFSNNQTTPKREVLHFKLSTADVENQVSWQLQSNKQPITGMANLPVAAIRSRSRRAKLFIFSNTNMGRNETSRELQNRSRRWNSSEFDCMFHIGDYEAVDGSSSLDIDASKIRFFEEFMGGAVARIPYLVGASPISPFGQTNSKLLDRRTRMPNTKPPSDRDYSQIYYDFVLKSAYYLTIDFEQVLADEHDDRKTFEWLLKRMEILDESTQIRWKVLFTKLPLLCAFAESRCTASMYGTKKYEELFLKHNFTLVISSEPSVYLLSHPFKSLSRCQPSAENSCLVQIIAGRGGKSSFSAEHQNASEPFNPLVQRVNFNNQTVLILEASEYSLSTHLFNTENGSRFEHFRIGRRMPNTHRKLLLFVVALAGLIVLLLVGFVWLRWWIAKQQKKSTEAERAIESGDLSFEGATLKLTDSSPALNQRLAD